MCLARHCGMRARDADASRPPMSGLPDATPGLTRSFGSSQCARQGRRDSAGRNPTADSDQVGLGRRAETGHAGHNQRRGPSARLGENFMTTPRVLRRSNAGRSQSIVAAVASGRAGLLHRLYRPQQYFLRRADHEQGSRLLAQIYGWGAGIFFFGYFLFEVPSNLVLEKVGARIWIARIMITWGIISTASPPSLRDRELLVAPLSAGAAEAGLLPRHDPVFHLLVSGRVSRPRDLDLFIAHPSPTRPPRSLRPPFSEWTACSASRLAVDLHHRGGARRVAWPVRLPAMTDRPVIADWLAPEERTGCKPGSTTRTAGSRPPAT